MGWTNEQVEDLKRLWDDGLSTGEIGKVLGMSKNAVVGKAHRLGLVSRPSPIRRYDDAPQPARDEKSDEATAKKKAVRAPVPEKAKPAKPSKAAAKKETHLLTVNDLAHDSCRWPIGDPKDPDFHFCGKKALPDRPYCAEHCEMAYVSTKAVR